MRLGLSFAVVIAALPMVGVSQSVLPRPVPKRENLLSFLPKSGQMNEVIAGQILVKLRPSLAEKLITKARGSNRQAVSQISEEDQIVPGGTIRSRIAKTGWTLWLVPKMVDTKALAKELMKDPRVLAAQPSNRIYPLLAEPNDPDWYVYEDDETLVFSLEGTVAPFRRLWHLIETSAFEGWNIWPNTYYTALTKPIDPPTIAIIDTGCDLNHPDFRNAGGASTNSAFGGQLDLAKSARFELGEIVPGAPEDLNGHGTHVTGIALASGNNGAFAPGINKGTLGTGYPCKGIILRVFDDSGVGTDADAAGAIYDAIDKGADVINLSLGTTNFSQLFQDAVTAAWQSGCVVIAAGNEAGGGGGDLGPIYPAACSGALAVSANGENWTPAINTYSGYGPYVDIAAPGGDVFIDQNPFNPQYKIQFVYSTSSRDPNSSLHNNPLLTPPYELNYSYLAGTSMASPAVAGAAGLYYGQQGLDQKSGWGNVRTYRALESSAYGVMGAPRGSWEYTQGYGSLNIEGLMSGVNERGATVGAFEGIVYYNGTALANVTVRANKPGSRIRYQTSTRSDGSYRFEMLPPGLYNVTAIPFGAAKTKAANVQVGSDLSGLDFWCGIYTGDETKPIVGRFDMLTNTPSTISVRHWGYDPETSIDKMTMQVGSTVGGSDIVPETEVFPESNTVTFTGLTVPPFHALQAKYTNGGSMTTTLTRATVPVTADAYVRDGTYGNTNYGAAQTLNTRALTPGYNRRAYFKLDLSTIPGNVKKTIFRFYAAKWNSVSPSATVSIYPTPATWAENTITWNNAPVNTIGAIGSVAVSNATFTYNWYEIDLTAYAAAEKLAGRNTISFYVQGSPSADAGVDIYSRERPTANQPRFIVEAEG